MSCWNFYKDVTMPAGLPAGLFFIGERGESGGRKFLCSKLMLDRVNVQFEPVRHP